MSVNAKTVYRIHIDGMTPTEKKIFGGMIHLVERDGNVFEVGTVLEHSDIFIFDSVNQDALEYARAHSHIARSTVWIHPSTHLNAAREISRPLRWSSLLEMMEQIVSAHLKPDGEHQGLPSVSITFDQLCASSEEILRKHIGVAAGFVVEDVRAERKMAAGSNEPITTEFFLGILKRQLPTSVDANKVIPEILAAIRPGGSA